MRYCVSEIKLKQSIHQYFQGRPVLVSTEFINIDSRYILTKHICPNTVKFLLSTPEIIKYRKCSEWYFLSFLQSFFPIVSFSYHLRWLIKKCTARRYRLHDDKMDQSGKRSRMFRYSPAKKLLTPKTGFIIMIDSIYPVLIGCHLADISFTFFFLNEDIMY